MKKLAALILAAILCATVNGTTTTSAGTAARMRLADDRAQIAAITILSDVDSTYARKWAARLWNLRRDETKCRWMIDSARPGSAPRPAVGGRIALVY